MSTVPFYTRDPAAWGAMPGRGRPQPARASHDTHLNRVYSMQGLPIPKLLQGVAPFDGNIIWLRQEASDADGSKVASFAAVYAEGPRFVDSVWAGGKLVYGAAPWTFTNIQNNALAGSAARSTSVPYPPMVRYPDASIRIYQGTTPQDPDPAVVADKGAARVDGWPGFVVVVFENFPLKDFGNKIPPTVVWLAEQGSVGDFATIETATTRTLEPPAFMSRDGLEVFGTGATGTSRRAVSVMSMATVATRDINEWTLPTPTYGVQQAGALDGVAGPLTYWPSESLWPAPWPIAMDDEERAYFLELIETETWDAADIGPLIGSGNNEGRWKRSPTKYRVVRVDPRTGARLSTSPFFRSPTTGEEFWWRPTTVGTVVANPDQGRAALSRVQLMTCVRGREQYLHVLFTSFPEDNDTLHVYWPEPQVDTSTPPPFTAPSGPYTDPGEVTHLPGSGRADIRSGVVVFRLPDLSAIHATVDLGARGIIPTGLARGPAGTLYVLGTNAAHRRYGTAPVGRKAMALQLAGADVRGIWDLSGVPVTDNSTWRAVFEPETGLLSASFAATNGTAGSSASGTISPVLNASDRAAGDFLIWAGFVRDDDHSGTISTPSGFTAFPGNPYGTGVGAYAPRVFLFWKIATGSEPTVISATYSLHSTSSLLRGVYARIYRVRASNGFPATPVEAISTLSGTTDAAGTLSCPTVTPSGTNRLGLLISAVNEDAGDPSDASGASGGVWRQVTAEFESATGGDGTIDIQRALLFGGGAISGGTVPYGVAGHDWVTVGFAVQMNAPAAPSATELARNITEQPWPMMGFHDLATATLDVIANRRPQWPDDFVATFPRKVTYTGTLYGFDLPAMTAAGSFDRIPVAQATQVMAGPDGGRIWLRGDFDTHQETSTGVYTVLAAAARVDKYHEVDLSTLTAERTVDYGEAKAANITPQSFKMWSNDFLYDRRRLMHSFMGRSA